jgi:hypothetical protein
VIVKTVGIVLLTLMAVVYAVHRGEGGTIAGLTIERIDGRSMGVYDGTFMAHVIIYNGTGKALSRIKANATCTDASGTVVGTGSASLSKMAIGETDAIDITLPKAAGCQKVEVKATGLAH